MRLTVSVARILSIILFLFYSYLGYSQVNEVAGIVTSSNGNGINKARILLFSTRDSLVKMDLTNQEGAFKITLVKPLKTFTIKIESAGFQDAEVSSATFKSPFQIQLKEAHTLSAVNVRARREVIELSPSLINVNVENSPLLSSGSVIDILSKTPRVLFDPASRSVSIDGKTSFIIYVNNRQVLLTSDQVIRYLESLPAGSISRLEINTNPSAKYDAQGGVVIMVYLKKSPQEGLNGDLSISPGYGKYAKLNTSLNLAYRDKKYSGYTMIAPSYNKTYYSYILKQDLGENQYTNIDNYRTRSNGTVSIKNGIDYQITPTLTLGGTLNGSLQREQYLPNSVTDYKIGNSTDQVTATNRMNSTLKNISGGVGLRKELPSQKASLSIDADLSRYVEKNETMADFSIRSEKFNNTLSTYFPYDVQIGSLKLDYSKKLKDVLSIEMGGKLSSVQINTEPLVNSYTSRFLTLLPQLAASFNYDERISSLYLNGVYRKGSWLLQGGFRAEHSNVTGLSAGKTISGYKYWNGFPSLTVQYNSPKKFTYSLSASRKISRPNFNYLNPAYVYVDPFTIIAGNPALKPQFFQSVQAGFTTPKRISLTVIYQKANNRFFEVIYRADSIGQLINSYLNFDHERRFQATLSLPVVFNKQWRSTLTTTGSYAEFESSFRTTTVISQPTFIMQWMHSLTVNNWNIDMSLVGRTKTALGYMYYRPLGYVNIGAGRSLWNGNGSIKFAFNDVFHSIRVSNYGSYIGTNIDYHHINETRVLYVTLSYKFGNQKLKAVNRKSAVSASELERYKEN